MSKSKPKTAMLARQRECFGRMFEPVAEVPIAIKAGARRESVAEAIELTMVFLTGWKAHALSNERRCGTFYRKGLICV